MLTWENTDQFGNLKVACSGASSVDTLNADLESLVEAVFAQHSSGVTFSVDASYGEIAAPNGDQVSHVLSLPFLSSVADKSAASAEIQQALREIVGDRASVIGPWD